MSNRINIQEMLKKHNLKDIANRYAHVARMGVSEQIIIEHMKTIKQRNYPEEVKNIQINIHLYTQ